MKKVIAPMVVGLTLAVSTVYADDSHHPEESGLADAPATQNTGKGMGQGMEMMDMEKMHRRMQEMQEIMAKTNESVKPRERQRLMQEHMKKMHEMMANMRGMMGPGMMMQSSDVDGKKAIKQMDGLPMQQRLEMMGQRVDMMQVMMEQMMVQMMMQQRHDENGK